MRCITCGKDFQNDGIGGRMNCSKECSRAYQKAYQKSDKYKAYHKAYKKTDKYKAYQKSDKYKAYHKAYHKKLREDAMKYRKLMKKQKEKDER